MAIPDLLFAQCDEGLLDPATAVPAAEGQARLVGLLASRGALRQGLSVETASDLVWTLCSLAVHDLLVIERGWTSEHYERWLTEALQRELLGD